MQKRSKVVMLVTALCCLAMSAPVFVAVLEARTHLTSWKVFPGLLGVQAVVTTR